MDFNGQPYLRITSPKTTNGILPLTINGVVQTKETHLPLSARKRIESKNNRLRKSGNGHLVSKIEVVEPGPKIDVAKLEAESMKAELEILRAQKAELEKEIEEKKKPGRPKKEPETQNS
jgi:hypothetical protein